MGQTKQVKRGEPGEPRRRLRLLAGGGYNPSIFYQEGPMTIGVPTSTLPPSGFPRPGLTEAELAELLPRVELIEEDKENLESDWHRLCMTLLIESIHFHFRSRDDYYA